MSINPLNDISRVYLEQVVESAVPGKPAERVGAVTAIPKDERDAARERTLAKAAAIRAKKGIKEGFVDPEQGEAPSGRTPLQNVSDHPKASVRKKAVGAFKKQMGKEYGGTWKSRSKDPVAEAAKPDYLDFDGDGNKKESMKKALRDKTKQKVDEAKKPNDGNLANNYPPYDKVTRGDVIAGALGKDQQGGKKKKVTKEGFSNWREDLIEVADKIPSKDKSEDVKITEKQVNNKIEVNPKLDLGEAVENLGGTLLEMVEIDEVDFVVESVYSELLDEGYEEDDIEQAIEYALTEATITYGHDTDKPHQKKTGAGHLVKAVGRLARQKLSSKVSGAKKAAAGAVAKGARKVAKGALSVARKMEAGDSKPSTAHTRTRTASTYRGAGAGTKEKVSSGSYTPPTKKKVEKPSDPWEGSATTPAKPKAKTKKAAAPKAKAPAAAKPKRKKTSKLDALLADIRSESVIGDRARNVVADQRLDDAQKETQSSVDKLKKGRKSVTRASASIAAKKSEDTARRMHPKPKTGAYRVEETQLDENTLSDAEKAKKEEIFKKYLKPKRKDFESRYPGRGEDVMHGVATKMAKKITEQAMEPQPKTQQTSSPKDQKAKMASQKAKQTAINIKQRELQALRSTPAGTQVAGFGG